MQTSTKIATLSDSRLSQLLQEAKFCGHSLVTDINFVRITKNKSANSVANEQKIARFCIQIMVAMKKMTAKFILVPIFHQNF